MLVANHVCIIKDNYCLIKMKQRITRAEVLGIPLKTVPNYWELCVDARTDYSSINLETLPSPRGLLPARQAAEG